MVEKVTQTYFISLHRPKNDYYLYLNDEHYLVINILYGGVLAVYTIMFCKRFADIIPPFYCLWHISCTAMKKVLGSSRKFRHVEMLTFILFKYPLEIYQDNAIPHVPCFLPMEAQSILGIAFLFVFGLFCTVPTFNSCIKCVGTLGIIQEPSPSCHPMSWAWMHG